jgi:hypothetical protein
VKCSDEIPLVADKEDTGVIEATRSIIWNYYKIDGVQRNWAVLKMFCARSVTLRLRDAVHLELSHISLVAFLGQKRASVWACVPIWKEDDIGMIKSKLLRKFLTKKSCPRNVCSPRRKNSKLFLDLTSLAKRLVTGEIKVVESKMIDATIASFFYENALSFNVADSPSFTAVINQCIEFGQQHPGRSYKAPNRRKIHLEVQNRLCTTFTRKCGTGSHGRTHHDGEAGVHLFQSEGCISCCSARRAEDVHVG